MEGDWISVEGDRIVKEGIIGDPLPDDPRPADSGPEGETELYRHYDAEGNLLYVGISLNSVVRLTQHRQASGWFDSSLISKSSAFRPGRRLLSPSKSR
jgi:hypothetical protein